MSRLHKVSDSDDNLLREFIEEKYESKGHFRRGLLMQELGAAIRLYVKMQRQNTHAHTHRNFHITSEGQEATLPKKLLKQRDQIVQFLEDQHYGFEADLLKRLNPNQTAADSVYVGQRQLNSAIAAVVGYDKRTLDKTVKTLKDCNLIRKADVDQFGITRFEFAPFVEAEAEPATATATNYYDNSNSNYVVDVEGIQKRQQERRQRGEE